MFFAKTSKLLSHLGYVYTANAINGVLGVISIPFVISILGNQNYGIYSIFLVLISYLSLITSGVSRLLIQELASGTDNKKLIQLALGIYLYISLFFIICLPIFIYVILPKLFPVPHKFQFDLQIIVLLAIVEFIISVPIFVSLIYTVANQNFNKYSRFIAIDGLLRYGLLIIGTWIYRDVVIVVIFILTRRVLELFLIKRILHVPPRHAWSPNFQPKEIRALFRKSFIISIGQIFQTIMLTIGAILLNKYHGIAVLGNYRAAFDLTSKIWFFSNGLCTIIFPKFSEILSGNSNKEALQTRLSHWMQLSWFGYLLISAFAIFSAVRILPLIHLSDIQIIIFFQILITGTCLNAHANVSYEYILAGRNYTIAAGISFSSTLIVYLSFYLLNGKTNPFAVAWAWLISQLLYSILSDSFTAKKFSSIQINIEMKKIFYVLIIITLLCISIESNKVINVNIAFAISLLIGGYFLLGSLKQIKSNS